MKNYYIINNDMEIYSGWDQVIVKSGEVIELPEGVKLPYHKYIAEASNLDRLLIVGNKKRIFKIIPPIKYIKLIEDPDCVTADIMRT